MLEQQPIERLNIQEETKRVLHGPRCIRRRFVEDESDVAFHVARMKKINNGSPPSRANGELNGARSYDPHAHLRLAFREEHSASFNLTWGEV
jgi:hypothetical protein